MIYPHTLSKKNKHHKNFLKEKRKDPITGDVIMEGDEIVLCGACKSAFLLDSWNYMDNKHCSQPFTLQEIPSKQHVQREVEEEKKYDFKILTNDSSPFFIIFMLLFTPILCGLMNSIHKSLGFVFGTLWISALFIFLLYTLFHFYKNIKINNSKVVFSSLFESKTIYLSEVEKLEFIDKNIDKPNDKKHLHYVSFILFLTSGQIKRIKILKDEKTITKIKELQEDFKTSSLQHKITLYEES
ncbi:hypothetical protein [Bernardetia sp.]|uniref:hypothetical protein n=1 Tax=Bernardetia sp. TaxID=1937974 RepID=UPI0025BCD986|nr:hypothetical protein [Bernardetia sp.]